MVSRAWQLAMVPNGYVVPVTCPGLVLIAVHASLVCHLALIHLFELLSKFVCKSDEGGVQLTSIPNFIVAEMWMKLLAFCAPSV